MIDALTSSRGVAGEQDGHRSERCAVLVRGLVQGVGFRPFVFGLATRLQLGGFVRNRADGVLIEVEGDERRIARFLDRLRSGHPPMARIEELRTAEVSPRGDVRFVIEASDPSLQPEARFFSPDLGTCDACLEELFDANDRRYLYPFINCTFCGPRLTITRQAPYDRDRTTMQTFAMCQACRAEYEDPADRRFHAQPIACPACGPRLAARDGGGSPVDVDPLAFVQGLLLTSRVVGIKGLGGYHLACDATSEAAAHELRERKHREEKPFAVMVASLGAARRICHVSALEEEMLTSARRPIVLLRRLASAPIAPAVSPNNPLLGVMLPYTPLHHLIARASDRPFVLTSGNRSDEPIAFEDDDALKRLSGIADGFLTHDRPIHLRCEDSVARVIAGAPSILRRSRGHAPEPIRLPVRCRQRVLALGGHLKSTFALGRGDHAFPSHHLGDLDDWSACRSFRDAVAHYESLFAFEPEVIAHDLHPAYATTRYALERGRAAGSSVRLLAVQHHHAHMAACMAENGLHGPAIGVTFDGTGYGSDGSLWGGEFLVGDYRSVRRAAHLRAVPLPGGEQGIREPWRMAVAHLVDCGEAPEPFVPNIRPEALRIVRRMIDTGLHSPPTSSAGRLFDAASALLGLRHAVTFEGQAAMELEWLAGASDAEGGYPFEVIDEAEGQLAIDTRPLMSGMVDAVRRGDAPPSIARRFHDTVAEIIARVTARLRDQTAIEDVVLTGGVFQNALLLEMARRRLEALGLHVHSHARVPTNDGGLSLGQLAVAASALEGDA
jgi:hydrogenase maturation protein HypF